MHRKEDFESYIIMVTRSITDVERLILTYETGRISVDLRIVQMLVENVMTG